MSTTGLNEQNAEANKSKADRLKAGKTFGFVITSDGWRSTARRNYHNYILVGIEGPIFLNLVEVTGVSGSGEDIAKGFEEQLALLGEDITSNIILGITDTPSANRKACRTSTPLDPST